MTKTSEILIAAKAKIADPANWTKGTYARAFDGVPVSSTSRAACRFCPMGALSSLGAMTNVRYAGDVIDILEGQIPGEFDTIADFNDSKRTTHADVMALFDRAIADALRQEEMEAAL